MAPIAASIVASLLPAGLYMTDRGVVRALYHSPSLAAAGFRRTFLDLNAYRLWVSSEGIGISV